LRCGGADECEPGGEDDDGDASGHTSRIVGRRMLHMSVLPHRCFEHIHEKLDVRSRAEAVARAYREGLLEVPLDLAGGRCGPDEGLLEVQNQVLRRLDPDREAHEGARGGERRVGGGRVRHPCRMLDQALDAAQ